MKSIDKQYQSIDLSDLIYKDSSLNESFFCTSKKNNPWDKGLLAKKVLKEAKASIDNESSISLGFRISNTDRSIGALISGYVAKKYGEPGLINPINLNFTGSAGQSFGCWNANGIQLMVEGDANDYVGKGMNGGLSLIHI